MDAAAELGRNDEQADAGRDCRTSRETKVSGTNADRGKNIFPVQLTTCRTGTGQVSVPIDPLTS